jgi:hypothetical protein
MVRSIGFKNGGIPRNHTFRDGMTVLDISNELELKSGVIFQVNGASAELSTRLYTGDNVTYSMSNIKGA